MEQQAMRNPKAKQIGLAADEADQDLLAAIAEQVGTSQTAVVLAFIRLWGRLPDEVRDLISTEARAIASKRRPGRRRSVKSQEEAL